MKPTPITALAAALAFVAMPVQQAAWADAGTDMFIDAYKMMEQAEQMEAGSEPGPARELYGKALALFERLGREAPDWHPNIVSYRTQYLKDRIGGIDALLGLVGEDQVREADPAVIVALTGRVQELTRALDAEKRARAEAATAWHQARDEIARLREAGAAERLAELIAENAALRERAKAAEGALQSVAAQPDREEERVALRSEMEALKRRAAAATARAAALEDALTAAQQRLESTGDRVRAADTRRAAALNALGLREREIKDLHDQVQDRDARLARLEAAADRMRDDYGELSQSLDAMLRERDAMREERDGAQSGLAAAQAKIAEFRDGAVSMEKALDAATQAVAKKAAERERAEAAIETLRARNTSLEQRLAQVQADVAKAERDRGAAEALATQREEKLAADLRRATARIAALEASHSAPEADDTTAAAALRDCLAENARLQTMLASAHDKVTKARDEVAKARDEVARARDDDAGLRAEHERTAGELRALRDRLLLEYPGESALPGTALVDKLLTDLRLQEAGAAVAEEALDKALEQLRVAEQEKAALVRGRDETVAGLTRQLAEVRAEHAASRAAEAEDRPPPQSPPTGIPDPSVADRLRAADAARAEGRTTDAREILEAILRADPESAPALSRAAGAALAEGRSEEAAEYLSRLLRVAPDDVSALTLSGYLAGSQGRFHEGVSRLTHALALRPGEAKAQLFLGTLFSSRGWHAAAEEALLEAVRLDPQDADAHYNLAVLYSIRRPADVARARDGYTRARALGAAEDPRLERWLESQP